MATVDPIRDKKDIETIKRLLRDHPRNHALFVVGINTALRASDLLNLRVKQVQGVKAGDTVPIKEIKTKKHNKITFNDNAVAAINNLLNSQTFYPKDFLFHGRDPSKPIDPRSLRRLVMDWCEEINLNGNYGSHTLRKSYGYHKRMAGVDLKLLQKKFRHSSPHITLDYLGITDAEINDMDMRHQL